MAQFVLVLDIAVVAVATPSIQADLEVAPTDPQAGEFIADAAVQAGTYRKQGTRWVAAYGETEVCDWWAPSSANDAPTIARLTATTTGGRDVGTPTSSPPGSTERASTPLRRAWADGRGGALFGSRDQPFDLPTRSS